MLALISRNASYLMYKTV